MKGDKMSDSNHLTLRLKANWLRRTVLEMAVKGKSGHVTTAFSLAELFVALYCGKILRFNPQNPTWEDRDRFVLSEGQAGLGLYPILADVGFFPLAELGNFLSEGSTLGVHSEPSTKGIDVLTGSLGHGLPIATGIADAAKIDGKSYLTICLTGDGELYEGSNWEAMLTVNRLQLENLILVVNRNHQFVIGFTDRRETQRDVLLDPLPEKLKAFGFDVRVIDGHDFSQIFNVFSDMRERNGRGVPLAIVAETVKGKGSSLADKRGWHYKVPTGDVLEQVRKELLDEYTALTSQAASQKGDSNDISDNK